MSGTIPPLPRISSWRAQGQGVLAVNVRQEHARKEDNERRSKAMLYFVRPSKKSVPPVATTNVVALRNNKIYCPSFAFC